MSTRTTLLSFCVLVAGTLAACDKNKKGEPAADYDRQNAARQQAPQPAASEQPSSTTPAQPASTPQGSDAIRGVVRETMNSGGYTYMNVETEGGRVWAAANQLNVAVGDEVVLSGPMLMTNFKSGTLDRTFEEIYFISRAQLAGAGAQSAADSDAPATSQSAMPPGMPAEPAAAQRPGSPMPPHGAAGGTKPAITIKPGEVRKLEDGYTVEELFAKQAELAGQRVRLRAIVVKSTHGILGKSWMHIQDGTGGDGTNDITVASSAGSAPVGATAMIEGTLVVNKDIGGGVVYPLLIEDAIVAPHSPASRPAAGE